VVALLSFLLLPVKDRYLLDWKTAERIPVGNFDSFWCGGLAFGCEGFQSSRISRVIGSEVYAIEESAFFLTSDDHCASVNFLTRYHPMWLRLPMLLRFWLSVAFKIGFAIPLDWMIGATLAGDCAFYASCATCSRATRVALCREAGWRRWGWLPPNGVVFGSGYLQMRRHGQSRFWLNIISIYVTWMCNSYFLDVGELICLKNPFLAIN